MAEWNVTGAALSMIKVNPAAATIVPGTEQQFSATSIYGDSSQRTLTAFVHWTSSNLSVATITDSTPIGLATGVASGTSTIAAESSPVVRSQPVGF